MREADKKERRMVEVSIIFFFFFFGFGFGWIIN